MKQWLSMLLAGVVGGLLVLAVSESRTAMAPAERSTHDLPVRQVNFAPGEINANVPFDFKAAAKVATPAVVHIAATSGVATPSNPFQFFFDDGSPYAQPGRSTGSGVIYTSDGYILTNNHVVEGAQSLLVTLNDNRKFEAQVIGRDEKTDLAVIKIEATGLPTLELADSDAAEIGEWVLAVGNPLDLTSTVTAGIISAKGRSLELLPGRDAIEAFLQTDAAVNPGNSGGALVDAQGRLLGINTAIATRTGMFQGYSFAIPINLAVRIVDDIIQYGSFQRAFLGVTIYPLDSEAAAELATDRTQGVVIDELIDGGSAQYAGLLPRDIIIQVNERQIRDVPELTEIVGRAKVGDVLRVRIIRKGKEMEIPVRMRADQG
ncbi:MAG: PDZ domain-containing protein [Bacteroidetes bacterium]|nr:MAG: PDZ domain-containing protein [Bacteroidota bacterium]